MRRVVIYSRVSTQDQEVTNQVEQLRQYAVSQSWEVVQILSDTVSGGKGISERKGLEQVFILAHRRKVDIVLFWALDRLSREGSRKTIEYLTRLESMGVDWHSYSEPYLSSLGLFKDAIIAILSALARQEKVRIGERTRAGIVRWRKENPGRQLGRPRTTKDTIAEVIELKEAGLNLTEIGNRMGVSAARVCQITKMGKEKEES